jgi:hypothetical protein
VLAGSGVLAPDYQRMWFTPEDLARAEEIIRARISRAELDALNRDPKLRGCHVTYFALALALCTVGKNAHLNFGYVPTKSISKMQQHFRIRSHGSHVRILNDALTDAGLLHCVSRSYRPEGWCRRYALAAVCYTIPFLAHEQPAVQPPEALRETGHRYTDGGTDGAESDQWDADSFSYSMKFSFTVEEEMRGLHPDVYRSIYYQDEGDPAEICRN